MQLEELKVITPVFLSQYYLKVKTICFCFVGFVAVFQAPLWATSERQLILAHSLSKRCASNISAVCFCSAAPICVPELTSWMQFVFYKLAL